MIDWQVIISTSIGVIGSAVGVGGWAVALRRANHDREMGVTTQEREHRRDTVADRDALIDQLQEDMREMRSRISTLEAEYEIERRWNRALVDHVYTGKAPPPPERPSR